MRKKVAIVLVFAMLNWNINILADTENRSSDFIEESRGTPAETEGDVQASGEGAGEKQEDAGQSDFESSQEEQTEENTKSSESTEVPENAEVPEEMKTSEDAEVPENTELSGETEESGTETGEETSAETTKADAGKEKQGVLQEKTGEQENMPAADEQENPETLSRQSHSARAEEVIYNVLFPTSTNAYLDPGDLSGRGQIFSDKYEVENFGNTDVAIKIKNIAIHYPPTEEIYRFASDEAADGNAIKNINVEMIWENEDGTSQTVLNLTEGGRDEYVLQLKAAECDEDGSFLETSEGGTGWFYFTGSMDPDLELDWEDEQIRVDFYYEIVNPENMDTDMLRNSRSKETDIQESTANSGPAAGDGEKESLKEEDMEPADSTESEAEEKIAESLPIEEELGTEDGREKEEEEKVTNQLPEEDGREEDSQAPS